MDECNHASPDLAEVRRLESLRLAVGVVASSGEPAEFVLQRAKEFEAYLAGTPAATLHVVGEG